MSRATSLFGLTLVASDSSDEPLANSTEIRIMFRVPNLISSARIVAKTLTAAVSGAASQTMCATMSSHTTWTPNGDTAIALLAVAFASAGILIEWKRLTILEHHFLSR